jgi:hypothetical protein
MSPNDPFFDEWVRDKLGRMEARSPDHLWNSIRDTSRFYFIVDRNKYLLVLLLLIGATGGIGYWAFHPPDAHPARLVSVQRVARGVNPAGSGGAARKAATNAARAMNATNAAIAANATSALAGGNSVSTYARESSAAVAAASVNADVREPSTNLGTVEPSTNADAVEPPTPGAAWTLAANAGATKASDIVPSFPTRDNMTLASAVTGSTAWKPILRTKKHIYLEAYAGPDHVAHYISASSSQYISYVKQVRHAETSYPSFSTGVKVDIPIFGDDWRMQLGIRYAQINERLNFFNANATQTIAQISTRRVVESVGDTVLVKDTSQVTTKAPYAKHSLNTYRSIDLPVIFSYTLIHAQQLQLRASAGALFNIASWYRGDIEDTNYLPVTLHVKDPGSGSAESAQWKKSIGTSLYGSMTLYYALAPKIQIGFEPYLRYELSTINKDISVYKERFVTTGLMLSIRYQLGR